MINYSSISPASRSHHTEHLPEMPGASKCIRGLGQQLSIFACVISLGCASQSERKRDFDNISGEGGKVEYRHPELDNFLNTGAWRRLWIVTGGQTGVDRAALDVALELNLPTRGWCPLGRDAEDGVIEDRYPLQQVSVKDPAMRTELNALDSDATLVLSAWQPKDGTSLTIEMAELHAKPYFVIDLANPVVSTETIQEFRAWILEHDVRVLNIGGPRESLKSGEVYRNAKSILIALLTQEP